MATPSDWTATAPRSSDVGVFVWDTDALLDDACDYLADNARGSRVLRAVDAGVLIAYMSEQAYQEVGWVHPKAARRRRVDPRALRGLVESRYLPRTRVVAMPGPADDAWAPPIGDVVDPDDVQHAQLARMIAPCTVHSHDRHLRRPGYAPADRRAYDERVRVLAKVTSYRLAAAGAETSANMIAAGASATTRAVARRLQARPALVGLGALLLVAAGVGYVLRSPDARRRTGSAAGIVVRAVSDVASENVNAKSALAETTLVTVESETRLEAQVASFLARNPDATITAIRAALGSGSPEHLALRELLESHSSFVETRPYHWAVGSVRTVLAV